MNQQSKLKNYENEHFMDSNNSHWWMVDNVCELLEIKDMENVIAALGADEKDEVEFHMGGKKQNKFMVVNLKGFFSLILRSKAPVAKKFRSWMTSGIIFKLLLSDYLFYMCRNKILKKDGMIRIKRIFQILQEERE